MKKLFIALASIALIILLTLFILGHMSKNGQALGLKNGQLQPCISIENCVITESRNGVLSNIKPFVFSGDKTLFSNKLYIAVQSLNGNIIEVKDGYIAATFSSAIFGFIDDLELRITDDNKLHFRASSRVGRSDLGVNKHRVQQLKLALQE